MPPPTATQTPAATIAPAAAAVSIQNFAFAPDSITVTAGTTVTWTNLDSVAHTVTADNGSFNSNTLAPTQTFSHTFTMPGMVTYHCAIHPFMVGTVIVTP